MAVAATAAAKSGGGGAAATAGIALIAGLGNPGQRYAATRHNAGARLVRRLQDAHGDGDLAANRRFHAETGSATLGGRRVRLVLPDTFVNLSGQAVAPLAAFYRIAPAQILVVHDELDLPPGSARLKIAGGHGGHNGLRDITARLGSGEYLRLRLGIGHPGAAREVSGYVLSKPPADEQRRIDDAAEHALAVLAEVVSGDLEAAMNRLHAAC